MPLDQLLIDVLACPIDKGPLLWFEEEQLLYNPRLKKAYEVRDDIPILPVDEARDVGEQEHERLVAKAEREGAPETGSAGRRAPDAGEPSERAEPSEREGSEPGS